MNIDELLAVMDETLEEAVHLPFTGGKRMVAVEKVRDIIDDIRLNMPAEIRQAKAIVQDLSLIHISRTRCLKTAIFPEQSCWRPRSRRCACGGVSSRGRILRQPCFPM